MNNCVFNGNICDTLTEAVKFTRTGKQFIDFSLAVKENKDQTLFLRCRAWEGTAKLLMDYCDKGDKITVAGALKSAEYQKNGQNQYYTYLNIKEVSFGFKPLSRKEEK